MDGTGQHVRAQPRPWQGEPLTISEAVYSELRHGAVGLPDDPDSTIVPIGGGVGHDQGVSPTADDNDRGDDQPSSGQDALELVDIATATSDLGILAQIAKRREGTSALAARQSKSQASVDPTSGGMGFCDASDGFLSFGGRRDGPPSDDDDDSSAMHSSDDGDEDELEPLHTAPSAAPATRRRDAKDEGSSVQYDDDNDSEEDDRGAESDGAESNEPESSPVSEPAADAAIDDFEAAEQSVAAALPAPKGSAMNGQPRQQLHGVTMQRRAAFGFASATLVALSRNLTVRAPCAVWAICGATSVGGCIIQAGTRSQYALLQGGKAPRGASNTSDEVCCVSPLPQKRYGHKHKSVNAADRYAAAVQEVEDAFGAVDWNWVARVSSEWKHRLGSMPTSVLLIEPPRDIDTSAAAHKRARFGKQDPLVDDDAEAQLIARPPDCIARRVAPFVTSPLFHAEFVPLMLKAQQPVRVIVIGQQGVGKSTACRELANAFVSRHGRCLYLDLDPGQGELTPPGTMALALLTQPRVAAPLDGSPATLLDAGSTVLSCVYIGSTVVRDPCVASHAIAHLCDLAMTRCDPMLPLVVNTHGWIHGTGRRCTVEAIQRVRPTHVVHLKLRDDEDWVGEAAAISGRGSLTNPSSGLNSAAISDCGSAAFRLLARHVHAAAPSVLPRKKSALEFELLRLTVATQFVKPANVRISQRDARWHRYFGSAPVVGGEHYARPFGEEPDSEQKPPAGLTVLRVPLSRVLVVLTEVDDLMTADARVSPAAARELLDKALVAIASVPDAAVPKDIGEACLLVASVRCASTPRVAGFGVVTGLETDAGGDTILTIRTPLTSDDARRLGCNALVLGFQSYRLQDRQ